jgi:outer membrane protein assembly factor BamD (BamD/ComL family)
MKKLKLLFLCSVTALSVLFASCATAKPVSVDGLTSAEVFQRAQDAADQKDYTRALQYYTLYQQKFPDDQERGVWAKYEIAFLYHRMGQNAKSLTLFNDLLVLYQTPDNTLPAAPRVLAEKLKGELEQILKKQKP